MPRKKKTTDPIGVGLTAKQMKRKNPINTDMMRDIDPLTQNQQTLFDAYAQNKHLVAYGCAGVGEVGETYDKLKKSHPGWNDVLHKVSKMPGSNVNPV